MYFSSVPHVEILYRQENMSSVSSQYVRQWTKLCCEPYLHSILTSINDFYHYLSYKWKTWSFFARTNEPLSVWSFLGFKDHTPNKEMDFKFWCKHTFITEIDIFKTTCLCHIIRIETFIPSFFPLCLLSLVKQFAIPTQNVDNQEKFHQQKFEKHWSRICCKLILSNIR